MVLEIALSVGALGGSVYIISKVLLLNRKLSQFLLQVDNLRDNIATDICNIYGTNHTPCVSLAATQDPSPYPTLQQPTIQRPSVDPLRLELL